MQTETKISYEATAQGRCFIVNTNFELPNVNNMSEAAVDWLTRLRQMRGIEQLALCGRYRMFIEIGQHFEWDEVWPQVEQLMRWLALSQQASDAKQVDATLRAIEFAKQPPQALRHIRYWREHGEALRIVEQEHEGETS